MVKVAAIVFLLFVATAWGVERKEIGDLIAQDITDETQLSAPCGERHINLVWWIPFEYWQATLGQDTTNDESDMQLILSTLEPFLMLSIVQGDMSPLGSFSFYSEDVVCSHLQVTFLSDDGEVHLLNPVNGLTGDAALLVANLKPILAAAMGNLGENMHFLVFEDIDEDGQRLVDPYSNGKLQVRMLNSDGDTLRVGFDAPLNSLFVPRKCPNGRDAHVSWKYCPWTGEELPD